MNPQNSKKIAMVLPFIPCPNCGGRLVSKEKMVNLCNIQCTQCPFAAGFVMLGGSDPLILSINSADIEPMLAQKTMLPPLIFYRSWKYEDIAIQFESAMFYPFIPYTFLAKPAPAISITGQHEDILLYVLDHDLPHDVIYTSPSDEEIAEIVSNWNSLNISHIQMKFHMGYARSARIKDEAIKIRRRKGLPVEEQLYEDDGEDDDIEELGLF